MVSPRGSTRRAKSSYEFLVSACLAGANCTHDGRNNLKREILDLVCEGRAVALCPEILGGLGVPRESAEIVGGDGADVLRKKAKVITASGRDYSGRFVRGARKALEYALERGIKKAMLKSNSPSCGRGRIYDGTFKKILKRGNGVCAALLLRHGIHVLTERDRIDA